MGLNQNGGRTQERQERLAGLHVSLGTHDGAAATSRGGNGNSQTRADSGQGGQEPTSPIFEFFKTSALTLDLLWNLLHHM